MELGVAGPDLCRHSVAACASGNTQQQQRPGPLYSTVLTTYRVARETGVMTSHVSQVFPEHWLKCPGGVGKNLTQTHAVRGPGEWIHKIY